MDLDLNVDVVGSEYPPTLYDLDRSLSEPMETPVERKSMDSKNVDSDTSVAQTPLQLGVWEAIIIISNKYLSINIPVEHPILG